MRKRFSLEDFNAKTIISNEPHNEANSHGERNSKADVDNSYEIGFQAGWDECLSATKKNETSISEAFGLRLQSINMDHETITKNVIDRINSILAEIFEKVIPSLVTKSFAPTLVDEIKRIIADGASQELVVEVCQEEYQIATKVKELIHNDVDVSIRVNDTLGLSQAFIEFDSERIYIDMSSILNLIENAFDEMMSENEKVKEVG